MSNLRWYNCFSYFYFIVFPTFARYFILPETTKQIRRDAYLGRTIFSTIFKLCCLVSSRRVSHFLVVSRLSCLFRFPSPVSLRPLPPRPKLHLAPSDQRKGRLWKSAAKRICNGKRSRDLRLGSPYRLSFPSLLSSFSFFFISSLPGFHPVPSTSTLLLPVEAHDFSANLDRGCL